MIKWMQGKRFSVKTTIIVIVIALVGWAFVVYMNIENFVPDDFTQEQTPEEGPGDREVGVCASAGSRRPCRNPGPVGPLP